MNEDDEVFSYDKNAILFLEDIKNQIFMNNPNILMECFCDTNKNDMLDPLEISHLDWEYSESDGYHYLNGFNFISNGQYIDSIPTSIQLVETLENITITNSSMVTIPYELFNLPNLRTLNLYKNNISIIPDEFEQLDSTLYLINLSGNNLTQIPSSLFMLNNAKIINLNDNEITSITDDICNLNSNTNLSLSQNLLCHRENVPDCYESEVENQIKCYSEIDLDGVQAIIDSNNVTPEICDCDLNMDGSIEAFEFGEQYWQPWTENAKLLELDIHGIHTFPKTAIENLSSLEYLNVSHNLLDTLFSEIGGLQNLIELNLSYNELNILPDEILNLENLRKLKVQNNDSLKLMPIIPHLDEINISYTNLFCQHGSLEHDKINQMLENGTNVIGAYMQYCYMKPDITFIRDMIEQNSYFTDWKNTGEQIWVNGRLQSFLLEDELNTSTIPSSIGNLTELINLEISKSNVSVVPNQIEGLIKLNTLNLSNNEIDTISFSFNNFDELQHFNISSNNLYEFPASVCEIPIIELIFEDNQICDEVEPPCPIFYWEEQLQTQRCKNLNDIEFIQELITQNILNSEYYNFGSQIWEYVEGEELDRLISFNHIGGINSNDTILGIPDNISNLEFLYNLTLENHSIITIPDELYNLNLLKILNLQSNKINNVSNLINGLDSLINLNLSQNQITLIPDEIGLLGHLIEFDISNNQIDSLPNSLGDLSSLEILNISDNLITQLPGNFENLGHLNTLDISSNQLESLPQILCDELQIDWDNPEHFIADDNKLCDENKIPNCITVDDFFLENQNCD